MKDKLGKHKFYDNDVTYSHVDFLGKAKKDDDLIYLDVKFEFSDLPVDDQVTLMLSRVDLLVMLDRLDKR